jgi:hypothetical protein
MKKRPSSFKAGYFEYELYFDSTKVTSDHGETDTENKILTVYDRNSEDLNRETLFHELMHVACDDSYVFEGDHADDLEERMIRILSPKLMQIFRDNPELSEYLFIEGEEDYEQ